MILQRDKRLFFILVAAVLIFAAGTVIWFINSPKAQFTMDINPSIQITTNQLNRVTRIEALNDDARDLLTYYAKPQKNLEAVINDLLDLMVFTGYIHGGSDNTVMITVSDTSVDKAILDRVNQAISDYLAIKQIGANIVNQTLDIPESTNALGAQLTGREAFIEKIALEDRSKSRDELMTMSLNDLIAYAGANQIAPDRLISVLLASEASTGISVSTISDATTSATTTGSTSATEPSLADRSSEFITIDRAKAIALSQVSGTIIDAELDDDDDDDDDDDTPEYEIKIRKDNQVYEIKIHAITGQVLKIELDDDDDDDDDEDDDDDNDDDDNDDDDEDDSRGTTGTTVATSTQSTESTTAAATTAAATTAAATTTFPQSDVTRMTASEARQAVLSKFGGIIQKIEYAYDDTNPHYKGEALKDGSKVVFELNARTKSFTKWDTDNDNSWDDFASALPNMITLTQAANLVVARSEQSNTFVQKIDFNWDDSEPLYQGEAFNKGVKFSFEIYAYGGAFKKWDSSRDDDTWTEKYYNVK